MLDQLLAEAPRFYTYYNLLFLGQAGLNTLLVSFLGCLIGYLIGLILATARLPQVMRWTPVRAGALFWTEIFRRIPFLVLLLCVFFGFQFSGAQTSLFTIAVTAVVLRMSALATENVRAGYEAVSGGMFIVSAASHWRGLTAS